MYICEYIYIYIYALLVLTSCVVLQNVCIYRHIYIRHSSYICRYRDIYTYLLTCLYTYIYTHIYIYIIHIYIYIIWMSDKKCHVCIYIYIYIYMHFLSDILCCLATRNTCTARSVEDETRNGDRNAKRNPNRNQETTVLGLFSNFQMKRDLEK